MSNNINWGKDNLTYNDIIANFKILHNKENKQARDIILNDMWSKNNPYEILIHNKINWFFKLLFKNQIHEIYLLGFKRGFKEGGLAMENEYLSKKN